MIDFRYHVVSMVAVFLALSVGIVLGSSFLSQSVLDEVRRQASGLRTDNVELRGQVRDLRRDTNYRDQFLTQLAPTLLAGRLAGQSVLLVTLDGADQNLVDELATTLTDQAGAKITGQVSLRPKYSEAQHEKSLAAVLEAKRPSDLVAPKGSVPEEAATELAHVLVTTQPENAKTSSPGGEALLSGLRDAGFVQLSGEPQRRATLAVVVAPPVGDHHSDNPNDPPNESNLRLIAKLDQGAHGAVLVGPEGAAEEGGAIGLLRASGNATKNVSTVDTGDAVPGRVAVVLALVAETTGKSGHYGVHGPTDGPLPPVLKPAS